MTRPSIPRAAVAEAERLARAGHRVTLRRGDVEMIVEPPGTVPPSDPDSALDRWLRGNGGGVEGAA